MSTSQHDLKTLAEQAERELTKMADSFGTTAREFSRSDARIRKFDKKMRAALHHPGQPARPFVRQHRKVGRNEVCPCGSGRKYKRCHGVNK